MKEMIAVDLGANPKIFSFNKNIFIRPAKVKTINASA